MRPSRMSLLQRLIVLAVIVCGPCLMIGGCIYAIYIHAHGGADVATIMLGLVGPGGVVTASLPTLFRFLNRPIKSEPTNAKHSVASASSKPTEGHGPSGAARRWAMVNIFGALVALAVLAFGVYETHELQLEQIILNSEKNSIAAERTQLTHINTTQVTALEQWQRQARALTAELANEHGGLQKQSIEQARNLITLPGDGALIVASVVGPNTHHPNPELYPEQQCYHSPPGYTYVPVQKEPYPGGSDEPKDEDTHGGKPLCGSPTNCMASNMRCWNIRLISGCLVNTEWYKERFKMLPVETLDLSTRQNICSANTTL